MLSPFLRLQRPTRKTRSAILCKSVSAVNRSSLLWLKLPRVVADLHKVATLVRRLTLVEYLFQIVADLCVVKMVEMTRGAHHRQITDIDHVNTRQARGVIAHLTETRVALQTGHDQKRPSRNCSSSRAALVGLNTARMPPSKDKSSTAPPSTQFFNTSFLFLL